jgi:hypothetical protein
MFSKKISWFFLTSLFTFDAVVSYWAVVYRSAHEANPAIKVIVETYPLLYFLTIPALVLIMYLVYKGLCRLANKIYSGAGKEKIEKVILNALVMYWILGNSSINFLFLIGFRQPAPVWYLTTTLALIPASVYSYILLRK